MPNLNIFFADLIAYVPAENEKSMHVLLPVSPPETPHEPFLFFNDENYKDGDRGDGIGQGGWLRGWTLDREELSIPNGQEPSLQLGGEISSRLPSSFLEPKFKWVTPIDSLQSDPEGGRVLADCLNDVGLGISSRMKLDQGKMESFHFLTNKDSGDPLIFTYQFEHGSDVADGEKRALVNATVCRIPFAGDTVEIHSKKIGGTGERNLVLELGDHQEINVAIVNLECQSCGEPHGKHFKFYYPLVAGWNSPEYIPFRLAGTSIPGASLLPDYLRTLFSQLPEDITLDREACPHVRLGPPVP